MQGTTVQTCLVSSQKRSVFQDIEANCAMINSLCDSSIWNWTVGQANVCIRDQQHSVTWCVKGGTREDSTIGIIRKVCILSILWPTSRKRVRGDRSLQEERSTEQFLRSVLGRKCGCKKQNCFSQFLDGKTFESLQSYRAHYYDLHKLDQDSFVLWHWNLATFNLTLMMPRLSTISMLGSNSPKVFDKIRDTLNDSATSRRRSWQMLEQKICRNAWKALHGLGHLDMNHVHKLWFFLNFDLSTEKKHSWTDCVWVFFNMDLQETGGWTDCTMQLLTGKRQPLSIWGIFSARFLKPGQSRASAAQMCFHSSVASTNLWLRLSLTWGILHLKTSSQRISHHQVWWIHMPWNSTSNCSLMWQRWRLILIHPKLCHCHGRQRACHARNADPLPWTWTVQGAEKWRGKKNSYLRGAWKNITCSTARSLNWRNLQALRPFGESLWQKPPNPITRPVWRTSQFKIGVFS